MIGLVAHSEKKEARAALRSMIDALESRGMPFLLEKSTALLAGRQSALSLPALARKADLLVVLGGDGTILRVVHALGEELLPIFGINTGSLGFLTCAGAGDIDRALDSITASDYVVSRRSLLCAQLVRPKARVINMFGLNDVVVSRGERSERVKIRVEIDGAVLTDYNADGLIIATPTGSTAYSLSAGGPILMPDSGGFVVTPICPHVLTNRSTVVSDRSVLEARLIVPRQEVFVTVDGRERKAMRVGDVLRISKSQRELPLVMLPERLFPEVLRQKLKWSGSNI